MRLSFSRKIDKLLAADDDEALATLIPLISAEVASDKLPYKAHRKRLEALMIIAGRLLTKPDTRQHGLEAAHILYEHGREYLGDFGASCIINHAHHLPTPEQSFEACYDIGRLSSENRTLKLGAFGRALEFARKIQDPVTKHEKLCIIIKYYISHSDIYEIAERAKNYCIKNLRKIAAPEQRLQASVSARGLLHHPSNADERNLIVKTAMEAAESLTDPVSPESITSLQRLAQHCEPGSDEEKKVVTKYLGLVAALPDFQDRYAYHCGVIEKVREKDSLLLSKTAEAVLSDIDNLPDPIERQEKLSKICRIANTEVLRSFALGARLRNADKLPTTMERCEEFYSIACELSAGTQRHKLAVAGLLRNLSNIPEFAARQAILMKAKNYANLDSYPSQDSKCSLMCLCM